MKFPEAKLFLLKPDCQFARYEDQPADLGFQINAGAVLETRGDFLFSDARSSADWYMTRVAFRGSGDVKIGGDFTIDSQIPNPSAHNLDSASLYVSTRTFSVGGVLTVKNSNGDDNILKLSPSESGTFTRTLGGLSIEQNGMIQLGGNASSANTTELILQTPERASTPAGF